MKRKRKILIGMHADKGREQEEREKEEKILYIGNTKGRLGWKCIVREMTKVKNRNEVKFI